MRIPSKKIAAHYLKNTQVKKLQIGSGSNAMPGWLNTDLTPTRREIIFMDATKKFPFENCTFDYVYSEHFIEHVDYTTGPGGKIRVTTPDLKFLMRLYDTEKTELERLYIKNILSSFYPNRKDDEYPDAFILNNNFRAWGQIHL